MIWTIGRSLSGIALAALVCAGGAPPARADMYFNSSEPGCDGSDPAILWCDDFEDGVWAKTNADRAGGPDNPANDGWAIGIFYDDRSKSTLPPTAACGGRGADSDCAALQGSQKGASRRMGKHGLANEPQGVDQIYVRYYLRPLPGFSWGHEKMLTINPPPVRTAGIHWGTLSAHFGSGVPAWYVPAQDGNPAVAWRRQNLGNALKLRAGPWYYLEVHLKLNTPGRFDGVYELWADDCGPDGKACTGKPGTLRARHTDVLFRKAGDTRRIGSIWFESWGNPASSGDSQLDQIVASRRHVGPLGSAGQPVARRQPRTQQPASAPSPPRSEPQAPPEPQARRQPPVQGEPEAPREPSARRAPEPPEEPASTRRCWLDRNGDGVVDGRDFGALFGGRSAASAEAAPAGS